MVKCGSIRDLCSITRASGTRPFGSRDILTLCEFSSGMTVAPSSGQICGVIVKSPKLITVVDVHLKRLETRNLRAS
jgi:hypothetical protein